MFIEISDQQLFGARIRPRGLTILAQPHSGDCRAFYTKPDKMDREQQQKKPLPIRFPCGLVVKNLPVMQVA